MENILKNHILSLALIATLGLTGVASAQVAPQNPPSVTQPKHMRGEKGSNHNLKRVSRALERQIDNLEKDQHDYAGHRVAAINALKQAN